MSVFSLIVCDRCGAQRRCHHAASPRVEALHAGWVNVTYDGARVEDLRPGCAAKGDDL